LARYSGQGDGPVVLDNWKTDPRPTVVLQGKLPAGSTLHPELSFDGRRILFSYCDYSRPDKNLRRFFIYECGLDSSGLRQITGTRRDPLEGIDGRECVLIEDWDPCYLPDGGIAFVSTRNQGSVRCHFGDRYCPTFTLYRCEADGSQIRPMVFGEANEWDPSLLDDGRVIWTRWDYINRHDTIFQSLWTIRPDGTGTQHFYGNYTRNPCSIMEARSIPGSRKVVATASAHHSYTAGSIIIVDPLRGQDGQEPLERVTPEIPFPETEGWGRRAAATPWALNEDLFLCAYSLDKHASQGQDNSHISFAIYLVDTLGGRELIYRDQAQSCFSPIPIRPHPTPPLLPSVLPEDPPEKTGTFYVENVYQSTESIPRGTVKRLRVVEVLPQTAQCVPPRSATLFETAKRIVGSVPVNKDGSVAFRAPAERSLLFQLLDADDQCVMSMRSFVYLHPGEKQGCTCCHEPRGNSPTASHGYATAAAAGRMTASKILDLQPPVGPRYEGGLSFARTVQPVLDRYCISCHGLEKTEGGINLLGTMPAGTADAEKLYASRAYRTLMGKPGLVAIAIRNEETPRSRPKDYFSHAGRLAKMLLHGDSNHPPLGDPGGLDRDSFRRVVQWLDLNAQFYGDYSWNKPDWRRISVQGEKNLRRHIRKTFGAQTAEQPLSALVNKSMPELSRILQAPLAETAGGWGQFENGWPEKNHPGYAAMLKLVKASIEPSPHKDIHGTSGRENGPCHSNWVRKARADYRKQAMSSEQ
ncbi:MAG: hypothetical protein U9N87_02015, partial [Planctomycetota bacterium]|nr:hypothetical protein [Planctomycetota bacterium]